MKRIIMMIAACLMMSAASAQTLTFSANATTGTDQLVPVLTWSTSPAGAVCTASGDWSGTKAASGTETLPSIVSNKTYDLTCVWSDDRAVINWVAPTKNKNGTDYTNPKGYRVYWGTTQEAVPNTKVIEPHTTLTDTITGLSPGTWYFRITAFNQLNEESDKSNPASKTIVAGNVVRAIGITINSRPAQMDAPTVQ